ncbi:hypothetical protein CYMTET_34508, partial [Cymbomonas tetramitiformis]
MESRKISFAEEPSTVPNKATGSAPETPNNRPRGHSSIKDDNQAVRLAGLYIQDAMDGVFRVHSYGTPGSRWAHTAYDFLQRAHITSLTVLIWLAITFYEKPQWCITGELEGICENQRGKHSDYPTMGTPFISRWTGLGLEIPCLCILALECGLNYACH